MILWLTFFSTGLRTCTTGTLLERNLNCVLTCQDDIQLFYFSYKLFLVFLVWRLEINEEILGFHIVSLFLRALFTSSYLHLEAFSN